MINLACELLACNKYRSKPHICKPEHPYTYYVITLYPNYFYEFNYVKPISPYHYHVLSLLMAENYAHWIDYDLIVSYWHDKPGV